MRLIDADALVLAFCDSPTYSATMFSKIRNKINNAPTIDAAPVVHGRWVQINDYTWKCSECGKRNCYAYDENLNRFTDNYCPNCGARMDLYK